MVLNERLADKLDKFTRGAGQVTEREFAAALLSLDAAISALTRKVERSGRFAKKNPVTTGDQTP